MIQRDEASLRHHRRSLGRTTGFAVLFRFQDVLYAFSICTIYILYAYPSSLSVYMYYWYILFLYSLFTFYNSSFFILSLLCLLLECATFILISFSDADGLAQCRPFQSPLFYFIRVKGKFYIAIFSSVVLYIIRFIVRTFVLSISFFPCRF